MGAMDIPVDWTFKNASIAAAFDQHVREQLPWYDHATGAVAHIARHYIPEGGLVYDVGASTGNIGRALADCLKTREARLVAIDNSPQMAEIYAGPGEIAVADATEYEFEPYDVCVVFLCAMFVPPSKRRPWLKNLQSLIKPGGALIVFDKTEPPPGFLSTILHRLTIAGKVATGVSADDIIAKELSLCGIQRPLPESFMRFTFPTAVEFFRFGEFAGWVIERAE